MHLVETRFKQRYDEDLAAGDTSQKDILWWFGYLTGLLEGGLITQEEYDSLSLYIIEVLADEKLVQHMTGAKHQRLAQFLGKNLWKCTSKKKEDDANANDGLAEV